MNKNQQVKLDGEIRVAISGYQGKMGRMAVAAIEKEPGLALVATIGRQDDLLRALKQDQPDVLIDFTLPDCVFQHARLAIAAGVRPVIGASGLTQDNIASLQRDCQTQQLGGIVVPNFSISAVLMMQMASQAARYFPHAEIIEMHHPKKVDAPSGTAIATAERMQGMATAMSNDHPAAHCVDGVPIHSIRMPGLPNFSSTMCTISTTTILRHGRTISLRTRSIRLSLGRTSKTTCRLVCSIAKAAA